MRLSRWSHWRCRIEERVTRACGTESEYRPGGVGGRTEPGSANAERDGDARSSEKAVEKGLWPLFKTAALQWVEHKDARLGAALSYYSVFSLGPLIVIAIAIAGLFFGADAVRGEVTGGLKGMLGESGTKAIEGMLEGANKPQQGIIATVIGIGALIFAAIGVVVQLKDAMNTVWDVKAPPGKGIWGFARTYVLSFAGVLSVGFLLLVSMLLTTALAAAGKYLGRFFRKPRCRRSASWCLSV